MASISLKKIWLSYPVLQGTDLSIKSAFAPLRKTGGVLRQVGRGRVEVNAINGISLEIADGERVGLVGHNGAGKTSLLKVMAGIYKPQQGSIRRTGRTVAVINPNNGLHLDLTGRENIEVMGLLWSLSPAEINARIADIEAFTELGEFLSLPVSTYSAGMLTRLAFAVATSLDPGILLVDETFGAGDQQFVARAMLRMEAMMARSKILVFASHDLATLTKLTTRALLIERGSVVADGPTEEIARLYRSKVTVPPPAAAAE